jgi:hypothetical protein
LLAGLRESLAGEPEPLKLKRGTMGKSGKANSKRVVVRYDYGALFEPAPDDEEDVEDEDERDEDDTPEEPPLRAGRGRSRRAQYEVAPTQPLLAVRIGMYEPGKKSSFEPQVQFAVMSEWSLGDQPNQPDDRFMLQSLMLKRVSRSLSDREGIAHGARIRTDARARRSSVQKGEDKKLSCTLPKGVEAVSLYSLDSGEALERLASA